MKAKTIGTIALLAFVAISVGYLILGETQSETTVTKDAAAGATTTALADATPGAKPDVLAASTATLDGASETDAADAVPAHTVVAYYFHGTQRCMTCRKIERLAEEALREQFADAIEDGALEWYALNVDEPVNAHFVEDYAVVTSSVILVNAYGEETREWVNMEKVWQLVHEDESAFKEYIAEQVRKYLEAS
jgi:hypothetical protein